MKITDLDKVMLLKKALDNLKNLLQVDRIEITCVQGNYRILCDMHQHIKDALLYEQEQITNELKKLGVEV